MSSSIKAYWEERARTQGENPQATTDDVYLRELEINTLISMLAKLEIPRAASVVDIGCGNGFSLLRVAENLPAHRFLGLDYADAMVESARALLGKRPELDGRVSFRTGDATHLDEVLGSEQFDVAITDRCLINLEALASQRAALAGIARHVRSGGYYLAIENFVEGQENLNTARRSVGLPDIPIRWHNRFFSEPEFLDAVEPYFELVSLLDFSSSYYFATRVIYSAVCQAQGESPDYLHETHRIAISLPPTGAFSPIRLAVMRRK